MPFHWMKKWLSREENASERYQADSLYFINAEGVQEIPGLPPGGGEAAVPHPATFLALYTGGAARVYRPSDEALRQSRENARYMRADATIMECVELRQRATALLDWRIECDLDQPAYQQAADLVRKILRRLPRFMQYRETLLQAVWYGRYAVENVFAWDWIDGQKLVVVTGWSPIHGDKLVWRIDAQTGRWDQNFGIRIGMLPHSSQRLRQWYEANRPYIHSTDFGMAYFPPPGKRELVVIHRHMVEDGEYEEPLSADRVFGVGIRSRIYWVWYQKQQALAWLMEFLERSAFGIELWYYPAGNKEARREMLRAAQNRVGAGKNILLVPRPPGGEGMIYGVERLEPSMAGAAALKEIITDYFGHQIKRYILGQTLTTEAHATGLGSNLASIHLDTFMQIVRYDAQNLQETLTDQLVRRLVRWNWPGLDAQMFRLVIEVDKPDVKDRLEALKQAFEMGLRIRSADLRELLSLEQPGPEEEALQHPSYGPPPAQGSTVGPGAASPQAQPGPEEGPGGLTVGGEWKAESPGNQVFQADPQRELYSLPAGLPKNPRPGQIAVVEGKSYRFNENHRWELVQSPQISSSIFASTNIQDAPMTVQQALDQIQGNRHKTGLRKFHELVEKYAQIGLVKPKRLLSAIGTYPDAEPGGKITVVCEDSMYGEVLVPRKHGPIILQALAAEAGLISLDKEVYREGGAAQKWVGYFCPGHEKTHYLWRSFWTGQKENVTIFLESIKNALGEAGLPYHTLIPTPEGCEVIVCKETDLLKEALGILNRDILSNPKYADVKIIRRKRILGTAFFFGDENREAAAQIFKQILDQFWKSFPEKRERMSGQQNAFLDPLGYLKDPNPWFLKENPQWDWKTRAIAAWFRESWEAYQRRLKMTPEERAEYEKRMEALEKELEKYGEVIEEDPTDSDDEIQGAVFS